MATRPQQGGATALPTFNLADTVGQKVVRLPTASRRKVEQRHNRHTREAMREMRSQWKGRYIFPAIREMLPQAELVRSVEASPALALALAMFQTLDDEAKRRAQLLIAAMAINKQSAKQAQAMIANLSTMERTRLQLALDHLDKGEA